MQDGSFDFIDNVLAIEQAANDDLAESGLFSSLVPDDINTGPAPNAGQTSEQAPAAMGSQQVPGFENREELFGSLDTSAPDFGTGAAIGLNDNSPFPNLFLCQTSPSLNQSQGRRLLPNQPASNNGTHPQPAVAGGLAYPGHVVQPGATANSSSWPGNPPPSVFLPQTPQLPFPPYFPPLFPHQWLGYSPTVAQGAVGYPYSSQTPARPSHANSGVAAQNNTSQKPRGADAQPRQQQHPQYLYNPCYPYPGAMFKQHPGAFYGFPPAGGPFHPYGYPYPGFMPHPACVPASSNAAMNTPSHLASAPYGGQSSRPSAAQDVFTYPPPNVAGQHAPAYGNLDTSLTQQAQKTQPVQAQEAPQTGDNGGDDGPSDGAVVQSPSVLLDPQNGGLAPAPAANSPDAQVAPAPGPVAMTPYLGYPMGTKSPRMAPSGPMAPMTPMAPANASQGVVQGQDQDQRVESNREMRKNNDPRCDPTRVYTNNLHRPELWGPSTGGGGRLFNYTRDGQLAQDQAYTTEQLRIYLEHSPSTLWIQQAPSQCARRLNRDDRRCRWTGCPLNARTISAGWIRVAFDECPIWTTQGVKDPFKVAGVMHLWCFEQCFDIVELYAAGRVKPENRRFPKETSNPMSLERDSDREIVVDTLEPWFSRRMAEFHAHGAASMPRPHKESLSFALIKHHLRNQTTARQRARIARNARRPNSQWKTIDVHMGDLGMFARICKTSRATKRKEKSLLAFSDSDSEDRARDRASSQLGDDHTADDHTADASLTSDMDPGQGAAAGAKTGGRPTATKPDGSGAAATTGPEEAAVVDLLDSDTWPGVGPPGTAPGPYFDPLASFVQGQASKQDQAAATTSSQAAPGPFFDPLASSSSNQEGSSQATTNSSQSAPGAGPDALASFSSQAITPAAIQETPPCRGPLAPAAGKQPRASPKRKRSADADADASADERSAKVQHVDSGTAKRTRDEPAEASDEARSKRPHSDASASEGGDGEPAEQGRARRGSVDSIPDSLFGGSDDGAALVGSGAPEEQPLAEAQQQSPRESRATSPGRETEPA